MVQTTQSKQNLTYSSIGLFNVMSYIRENSKLVYFNIRVLVCHLDNCAEDFSKERQNPEASALRGPQIYAANVHY